MENTKALAYLYFSQSTAASTLAVTRNRNMLISKMHAFGYDLAGLCCDVENEDKAHPELAKTLENLDNRNFDAICILGVSHISRDPARLLEVIKKLNAHGVKLIDLSCNSELTAANLEMKLAMMAMISFHNAAFEREENADEMGDDYDYEADELEHLTGTLHRQLGIAKDDECADIQIVRHLADGQLTLKTGYVYLVSHFLFPPKYV